MKNRILKSALLCSFTIALMVFSVFAVNAALIGDVSADGKITADDARTVLRASVSLDKLSEELAIIADADGDGKLMATDARLVLRMSVSLEEVLHYFKSEVTLEPTCTEKGTILKTCTECDEEPFTVEIEALGHDYSVEVIEKVTCDKDGLEKHTCTRCADVKEEIVPLGHIWSIPNPTCTEDKICTREGCKELVAKLGHTALWGKCSRCKVFNTEKYAQQAKTVKDKFTEAKTAFDSAYAINSYNSMLDGISWKVLPRTSQAKPYYQTAKAAYEAAYKACCDIPEFKEIKTLLAKNIENINGVLKQVDKILAVKYYDSDNYEEMIWPLEQLNDFSSDSITATNRALLSAIPW